VNYVVAAGQERARFGSKQSMRVGNDSDAQFAFGVHAIAL
jgi:hypothetical protein